MNKSTMKKYAQAVVRYGANVKKGQYVLINISASQVAFARALVEEAYKAKASYVKVEFSDEEISKIDMKNVKYDAYMTQSDFMVDRYKRYCEIKPVMIHVVDRDPDAFKGLDMSESMKARMAYYPNIKPFIEAMENRYQWVICALPSVAWAKKVFPNDKPKVALKKLEDAILKTTRIDKNAISNWKEHVAQLKEKAALMNEMDFDYLQYTSDNGTNLKLHLMPNHNWLSAREEVLGKKNVEFTANMPTEEVFTMPKPDGVDGIVYSAKPLSLRGKLVEDFWFRFEKGKVVEVHARTNQDVLEQLISEDEASAKLGEVALVPYDSPISQSGILFYNTLFDENASCHLALGHSFKNCLKNYEKVSDEQWKEMGYQDSMNHVDFMIGTKDMNIVGVKHDGTKVQVFKDGNWAI